MEGERGGDEVKEKEITRRREMERGGERGRERKRGRGGGERDSESEQRESERTSEREKTIVSVWGEGGWGYPSDYVHTNHLYKSFIQIICINHLCLQTERKKQTVDRESVCDRKRVEESVR